MSAMAAAGRGEPIAPRFFVETADPTGTQRRHVVSAGDVVRGLGLRSDVAARVERMVSPELTYPRAHGPAAAAAARRAQLTEFLRTQSIDSDVRQEIERRAAAFWRRSQPGGNMRHVFKSSVFYGHETPEMSGSLEKGRFAVHDLVKAAAHKYITRKPDGKGGWVYEYAVPKKGDMHSYSEEKGHVAELKEGAELRHGEYNGIPYKRKIEKIEHDEKTGETHFHTTGFHGKHDKYTHHADGSLSIEGRKLISSTAANALRPQSGYTNPKAKYISVERKPDGSHEVKEHLTKMAAHNHGKSRREKGADINVHSKEDAEKYGLDPRKHPKNDSADRAARKEAPKKVEHTHVTLTKGPDGKAVVVGHPSEEAANAYSARREKETGAAHPVLTREVADKYGMKINAEAAGEHKEETSGVREKPAEPPAKTPEKDAPKKRGQRMTAKGIDHPPDPGAGKVNVRYGKGHVAVEAQKFGNYAVHREHGKGEGDTSQLGFTITHIPTGNALHTAGTKLEAQRFARHMQENAPEHFAGAKFGQTDFSAFPNRLKEFQQHITNARDASAYKSMRFVIPVTLRK